MYRRIKQTNVSAFEAELVRTLSLARRRLRDCRQPSLNCDSQGCLAAMKTHHPDNERIKRKYLDFLKEANGYSEGSLDGVAKALSRFEGYTKYRDFKAFHPDQAKAFKAKLAQQANLRTGEKLSKATLYSTLRCLKAFFKWLAGQPGYRSKLSYSDADYFSLSENDTRLANARRETAVPTLEQIAYVLSGMPTGNDIEMRNRAVIAFAILTGARDGALASFKLKHVDLEQKRVLQDAREVDTKRRKTFTTWFFPVGNGPLRIVEGWIAHLRDALFWGESDPLFPRTRIMVGESGAFGAAGLERMHWSTAQPISDIFREAFERAGLPYFKPHSFRNTLTLLGERLCSTPEDLKVWSQNLGHDSVLTTLMSYGAVASHRQAEVLARMREEKDLGRSEEQPPDPITVQRVLGHLMRQAS
jgi:integrase